MLTAVCLSTLALGSIWTDNLPTGALAPVVIPKHPSPNWSWDTIPLSLHGAVKTRSFTTEEIKHLAKYDMYTAEKWYTPCGSQGPTQSGPSCAMESKTEALYKQIKAINPKQVRRRRSVRFSLLSLRTRARSLTHPCPPSLSVDDHVDCCVSLYARPR